MMPLSLEPHKFVCVCVQYVVITDCRKSSSMIFDVDLIGFLCHILHSIKPH